MEKFFTYILQSEINSRFYIGSCADIVERLKRHNAGATISTKSGKPWIIVYTEEFNSKTEALQREKYLKKMKSRVLLEKLIQSSSAG